MEMASSGEILLASSPDNPVITAYDASSGAILAHFTGSQSPRKGLALAGTRLIVAAHMSYSPSPAASVHLYNWWSCTALHHLPLPEPVAPLTATRDGMYIFCGGISGYIHTLAIPSGHLVRSFPAHSKPVSCCIVDHDALLVISGGDDGTICVFPLLHIFDASAHHPVDALYCFSAHASSVTAVASGCGGSNIVSCSLDCTCKFWSLAQGGALIRTVNFPCMLWCLALDSSESGFYVGGSDGRVYYGVIKVHKRRCDAQVVALNPEHNGGAVTAVAMVNEERNLVSASEDGDVRIWEVESGKVVRIIANGTVSVSDIVVAKGISNDGVRLGAGGGGGGVGFREPIWGYNVKEISKPVRELNEMEESLDVVVKDRKRAIDILEGSIDTYQRLLGLMLKEAKGGAVCSNDSSNKDEDDDGDK